MPTLKQLTDEGLTAITSYIDVKVFPFLFIGTNRGNLYVYSIDTNELFFLKAMDEGITALALYLDFFDIFVFVGTDQGRVYSYDPIGNEFNLLEAMENEVTAITNSFKNLYVTTRGGRLVHIVA